MSEYLYKQNLNDDFVFNLIVALIQFLNNKLIIKQYLDNEETEYIIPFFYNASGDERFIQDIFQQTAFNQSIRNKVAEGSYDIIPRGHITLSSASIIASSLTNRFVRGEYQVETMTEIETMSANINIIPLGFQFEVKIKTDTLSMLMRVWENIVKIFYKSHAFEFMHEGMPIRAHVGFPEDNTFEHSYEFSFGDLNENSLTFNLEIESYMYVKDLTSEFKKSQRMEGFNVTTHNSDFNFKNIGDEIPIGDYIVSDSLNTTSIGNVNDINLNDDSDGNKIYDDKDHSTGRVLNKNIEMN
jgi:hypothetical protein